MGSPLGHCMRSIDGMSPFVLSSHYPLQPGHFSAQCILSFVGESSFSVVDQLGPKVGPHHAIRAEMKGELPTERRHPIG